MCGYFCIDFTDFMLGSEKIFMKFFERMYLNTQMFYKY